MLAGIVVALALIPEAIGFSIIAGVDPRVGLYASVAIAIVISLTGGRPGMISAATAAVAVLVVPLVRDHGVEYLFAATILMGMMQIAAGLLRLNLVMQFVSRSVITGFVNALAIQIFMAQLPQLTGVTWQAYAMVAGGLAIIYLLPRLTTAVPPPLVAIIVLTLIAFFSGAPVNTVADMGNLAIGHQRDLGRAWASLHLHRRRIPDVPARSAWPLCRAGSDASASGDYDHGVDQHFQLELDP